MHGGIGGTHFSTKKKIITSAKIRYFSACLLNDKSACSNVPWIEIVFEKTFQPAARYVCKINGRTSQSSDAMRFRQEIFDDVEVNFTFIEMIIRKTGSQ